eukprot:scaffold1885_cov161-Ochromonas_danica.AAC.18
MAHSQESSEKSTEPTGCVITSDDERAVVASVVCSAAYIAYGASAAALGAALPSLAAHFGKTKSEFGVAFTIRGLGYLVGTLSSAGILSFKEVTLSKEMITCLALLLTGITSAIISQANNYVLTICCFFIQGLGYGGVDTMANCVMPESREQEMLPVSENDEESNGEKSSSEEEGHKIAPLVLRVLVSFFFFTYVGVETGFAGWVPTYALVEHVTESTSKAAYLSSTFWATLTTGRVLAVPAAIYLSASSMIRIQLFLIVSTCFIALFTDANTTSMFMVGSTLGESIVPVLMGWAMAFCGPWAMPLSTFGGALILLAIYLYVHFQSSSQMAEAMAREKEGSGAVGGGEWGSRSQHALLREQVNPVHDNNGDDDDDNETKDIEMVPIQSSSGGGAIVFCAKGC